MLRYKCIRHAQSGLSVGRLLICAAVLVGLCQSEAAHAQAQAQPESTFAASWSRVTDASLSRVRGGFSNGTGLDVSFGIDRTVFVNGAVTATTNFNLVSNGITTSVPALSSVVQNALDGQGIRMVTTVNITANSLQVLKQSNVQSMIGNSLAASIQR